ncbi:MAG: hypothetical protein NVSMB9_21660 [Isosphaeraceae bacterium]
MWQRKIDRDRASWHGQLRKSHLKESALADRFAAELSTEASEYKEKSTRADNESDRKYYENLYNETIIEYDNMTHIRNFAKKEAADHAAEEFGHR